MTIDALSLPPGKTTDGVLTEFSAEITAYHAAMVAEANNPAHSAEQRQGYTKLALEYKAYNQFFTYLLDTVATEAERLEAAAFVVNFLASSSSAPAAMAQDFTILSVGAAWSTINSRRSHLEKGAMLSAMTDWGYWGILTNNPVVKVLDACLTIIKLLESSKGLLPALLEEYVVEVKYPAGGFYTDSADADILCKGTFVPHASLFINTGFSAIVGELLGKVKLPALDGKLDAFVGQGIQTTLLSDLLKNETMAQLSEPISALSRAFGKAAAGLVSATDVEFPCVGGNQLSVRTNTIPALRKVSFTWDRDSSAEPIKVGTERVTKILMDNLNTDMWDKMNDNVHKFTITVENYFPDITNSPACSLDQDGICTFWVNLADKDFYDTTYAKLAADNNLTEGTATLLQSVVDMFEFRYQSKDKTRETYTDVIKIEYGDDHEWDILSVDVHGPQPGTCASGPQTVNYGGHEWQRCDDGNGYSWDQAKVYCQNLVLGDHSNWRLPTKEELKSLVVCTNGVPTPLQDPYEHPFACDDMGVYVDPFDSPTIDAQFSCQGSPYYWTSTVYSETRAWQVYFSNGMAITERTDSSHGGTVRCVR